MRVGELRFRDWFRRRFARRQKPLGRRGEDLAAKRLKAKGYIIIARGHRDDLGEVDLIAVDGRTLVFVEVKCRSSTLSGHPAEAVDARKQARLTRAALGYMRQHDLLECRARFDVVSIVWPPNGRPQVEHFIGAFEASGESGGLFD